MCPLLAKHSSVAFVFEGMDSPFQISRQRQALTLFIFYLCWFMFATKQLFGILVALVTAFLGFSCYFNFVALLKQRNDLRPFLADAVLRLRY